MAVVTSVFENLARTAARAQGYPALRLLVLPHPMETRSQTDIDIIVRARFAEVIGMLADTI